MLSQPNLLATALHNQPRSRERDAQIYWNARRRLHTLLRDGRIALAAVMLDEIRSGAEALLSGPESGHALGRLMAQTAAHPFPGGFFVSKIRGAR